MPQTHVILILAVIAVVSIALAINAEHRCSVYAETVNSLTETGNRLLRENEQLRKQNERVEGINSAFGEVMCHQFTATNR